MHGIDNDFVLIDDRVQKLEGQYSNLSKHICNRYKGIGANGLIILQDSLSNDYLMRVFNPDGSEAETCGNGLRCLVKYLTDNNLMRASNIKLETIVGKVEAELLENSEISSKVKVNMGAPATQESKYFNQAYDPSLDYRIRIDGKEHVFSFMSIASPHAVFFNQELGIDKLRQIGGEISRHPYFPNKTNVHFVNINSPQDIDIISWERGVGITLGCGTGSCASVVAGYLTDRTKNRVIVHNPGGDLFIEFLKGKNEVYMTGPAVTICKGSFFIDKF